MMTPKLHKHARGWDCAKSLAGGRGDDRGGDTRGRERERVLSRQLAFVPSLFLSLFCAAAAAAAIARTFGEIRSYAAASVRPSAPSLSSVALPACVEARERDEKPCLGPNFHNCVSYARSREC